jgi:hypothetical protein
MTRVLRLVRYCASLLVVLPYGCDFAFMYCQGLLYSFVTCNQTYYYYYYVVQVYFQNVSGSMKTKLLTACEHNRGKAHALKTLYRITVPEQVYMMWPRMKTISDSLTARKKKRQKTIGTEESIPTEPRCKRRNTLSEPHIQQSTVEESVRVALDHRDDSTLPDYTTTTNASQVLQGAGSGFERSESRIDVDSLERGKPQADSECLRKLRRGRVQALPRFRVGDNAHRRRQLLTRRLQCMTTDVITANSRTALDNGDTTIERNVHDANQALCDSELDFDMNESFTDVDINNTAVELSSPPPLHRAAVRGQSRHSDLVIDDTGLSAGIVERLETIDSLGAPSQQTGAGKTKRKRINRTSPTCSYDLTIELTDKEEPAKRRRRAGGIPEGGDSAGVDRPDLDDVRGGLCNFSRLPARPQGL